MRVVRVLSTAFFCLAWVPALAAQAMPEGPAAEKPRPQGYTFFGVSSAAGELPGLLNLGGGGEGFIHKGLAAGGDITYLFPNTSFGNGIGIASGNLSYHFQGLDSNRRWIPFVTGGYSLGFRSGTTGLVNYGGGVTYWFRPRWGARLEVRNHQNPGVSVVAFRFGLSFR